MAEGPMQSVLHHIRSLVVGQEAAGLADSVLLERFLTGRDEAAFEALVRRYGPMVMGVCRRLLRNPEDSEDAFQATFLVLVRKAGSIAKRDLLGNWLYGVAYHTARAARSAAGRRRAKEAKAVARQQPPEENAWQELLPLLDQELSRLPDKYRIPVVLCELQGMSRQDVARQLGLPEGTLSSRLARARTMLARRLGKRGLALTGGALAAGLGQHAASAVVPPSLIVSTVKAGSVMLAGQSAAAGVVSAQVAALSEGVVKTMFLSKLKIATAVLLLGGAFTIGAGEATRQVWAARSAQAAQARAEKATQASGTADSERGNRQALADKSSADSNTKTPLQQALETAETITDPIARLSMLLRIASVQSKMGRKSEARKLRQEALQIAKNLADGRSKVVALHDVAHAQAEGEDRSSALETVRQAEQAATAIQDTNEKSNALHILLSAYTSLGDYEGALRTTAHMKEYENALIWIAASLRKESGHAGREVLKLVLQKAKSSNSMTDQRNTPLIYIAAAYARLGDLRTALEIADTLGNGKDQALEYIGIAQAETGDVEGALQTAAAIDPEESRAKELQRAARTAGAVEMPIDQDVSRAHVLQAIALAQEKAGDRAAARATLQKLCQIADKNPPRLAGRRGSGLSRATILREEIAEAQARVGDIDGALHTAAGLDSLSEKAKALLEIGAAQVEAGRLADARETLVRAARAADDSPLFPARRADMKTNTLCKIARQQAKAGDIRQALRTVKCLPPNRNAIDAALVVIVPAQAKAGDLNGGLETLSQIQDEEDKAFALEALVQAQVGAGDERGALALAARQPSPFLKAHALLAIASVTANQKDTKE